MRHEMVQRLRGVYPVLGQNLAQSTVEPARLPLIDAGRGIALLLLVFLTLVGGPRGVHLPALDAPLRIMSLLAGPTFYLFSGMAIAGRLRLHPKGFVIQQVLPSVWMLPCWLIIMDTITANPRALNLQPLLQPLDLQALVQFLTPLVGMVTILPVFALLTRLWRTVPVGVVLLAVVPTAIWGVGEVSLLGMGLIGFAAYFVGARAAIPLCQLARQSWNSPLLARSGLVALVAMAFLILSAPGSASQISVSGSLPFAPYAISLLGPMAILIVSARLVMTDFGTFLQSLGANWAAIPLMVMPGLFALTRMLDWMMRLEPVAPVDQNMVAMFFSLWG